MRVKREMSDDGVMEGVTQWAEPSVPSKVFKDDDKVKQAQSKMALYQYLCGLTVMIFLSPAGCQPLFQRCGLALNNVRIVGGQNAPMGSWPWQASLNNDDGLFCGGSLISNQWVMTAAHCVQGGMVNRTVFLGRHSQSGPNPREVSRTIDEIVCHPAYNILTNENDICLLRLSATVGPFGTEIFPVCLASAGSTFHTGASSWVTGWGATDANDLSSTANILQEVNVPIVGNNECSCAHPTLTNNMICAGAREGGRDACQGDSGGPLVINQLATWIQSGIASFGTSCGLPNSPGVYTRVSQYEEWISNVTGNSAGFVSFTSPGVDSDANFACPTSPPATTTTPTTTTTTPTSTTTTTTTTPTPTKTTTTTTTTTTVTNTSNNTTTTPGSDDDPSLFDSGENVIHFTHFISLYVLVISLYILVSDI